MLSNNIFFVVSCILCVPFVPYILYCMVGPVLYWICSKRSFPRKTFAVLAQHCLLASFYRWVVYDGLYSYVHFTEYVGVTFVKKKEEKRVIRKVPPPILSHRRDS